MITVLILGGTGEAAQLARALADRPGWRVISSLAGRTHAPLALPGEVRIGGFGGIEGLVNWLRAESVDIVVDATHPFAARMGANAAAACERLSLPWLRLDRPPWRAQPDDRWQPVADIHSAASAIEALGRRVFLACGRKGIEAFAPLADHRFLVRLIESADLPLADYALVAARGPFAVDDEIELLRRHRIEVLVCKNAGGPADAKLTAARALGLPVVMIERPPRPAGPAVDDVDAALDWLRHKAISR